MPLRNVVPRRIALSLALLGALAFAAPCANADGERLDIAMVDFGGKQEDFKRFRASFRDWMMDLSDAIPASVKADYLGRLRLVERETEFPSADALKRYWKESDSLQVLTGAIDADGNSRYFVSSSVYLGERKGTLGSDSLSIEVPFAVRDYADTKDIYSAVLLYGLAMDAEQVDPSRKALIAQLLKSARDKIADIKNRRTFELKAQSPLLGLEQAIAEAEARLKGR